MKIGITTFGGDGGKSGISRYIIQHLSEFAAMKCDDLFEVMTYHSEEKLFISDPEQMKSLTFSENIRNPIVNVGWHQVFLPGWCRRRGYDVLFLPAGNRRLPIYASCPTVGTVHDFSSIHVEGKYDPVRMFYIRKVLPFLIKRLTQVLTVSESSKKDIVEYAGIPDDRVTVTPLAADSAVYYPRDKEQSSDRVKSQYGISNPYILFISRIEHPGKNHARLIKAYARLRKTVDIPHQLVLAGSDWLRAEEVHVEAEKSGYADDIVFTGFVTTESLPDLYCGADLFVFPSLFEGFGLPVLEAMSCGIPVACSDISSIPEVAGDAAVLFDPYDVESIVESIKTLLMDSAKLTHYSKAGLQRSMMFSWKETARQTLEVIHKAYETGR